MIPRLLETTLKKTASYYPIVTLTGPRQSGKTTLIRSLWPGKLYTSLEDPDTLQFAQADPRGFLDQGGNNGMIVDEAQRHPPIFNYLQGYADRSNPGRYILSGSNNFLLMEKIGQSLAGRTAVLVLLPFSGEELGKGNLGASWEEAAWQGFYPRVRSDKVPADVFSRDYLATYAERDVRLVKNISDLSTFRNFLSLCAGRSGQLLNYTSLAGDAGISINTVKSWLSLLEAAWLIFKLPPWYENFSKRIIKSPKLYWHDTALLCYLLGIRHPDVLRSHPLRGYVFENLIIAERYKAASHRGDGPALHFWRDTTGREVDLIEGLGGERRIWECKAGATISQEFFKHLEFFGGTVELPSTQRIIAYGGTGSSSRSAGLLMDWRSVLSGLESE